MIFSTFRIYFFHINHECLDLPYILVELEENFKMRKSGPSMTQSKTVDSTAEPSEKREFNRTAVLVLVDILLDQPISYKLKKPSTTFGFHPGMK